MIGLIILILIVIFLFNSFSKFNSWTRKNENLLQEINSQISNSPDNFELKFKKAECLLNLQSYDLAWKEYKKIIENQNMLGRYRREIIQDAEHNIQFCIRPLPWSSSGPRDLSGSYWHYLMLKYFGNRAYKTAFNLN